MFFISCQKEIEIELPNFEQKPVVSCLFSPDTNFILYLSHSVSLNDSVENIIENAKCYLSYDKQIIDSFTHIYKGFYKSNKKPEQGKSYKFKIVTTNFNEITAVSYVPYNVQIINIEQQDFAVEDLTHAFSGDVNLPLSKLSITFFDNKSVKNYYELKLKIKQNWHDSIYDSPISLPALYSYDEIIRNEDILDYTPNIFVFSDSLFNGQTITIDFLYKLNYLQIINENQYSYNNYRLYYQFRSISKEMYNYRKSLIKHIYNQQTDNIELFGDPVQMFTNIKNGLGIFAGYNGVCDTVFVEKTIYTFL